MASSAPIFFMDVDVTEVLLRQQPFKLFTNHDLPLVPHPADDVLLQRLAEGDFAAEGRAVAHAELSALIPEEQADVLHAEFRFMMSMMYVSSSERSSFVTMALMDSWRGLLVIVLSLTTIRWEPLLHPPADGCPEKRKAMSASDSSTAEVAEKRLQRA